MSVWHVSAWWSVICLWPIGIICILGLFYENYRENWLQFIGLTGFSLWAFGRGAVLFERALEGSEVGDFQLIGHVSMLCFALGTAVKVYKYNVRPTL